MEHESSLPLSGPRHWSLSLNLIYINPTYFPKIHSNIIFLSTEWFLYFRFSRHVIYISNNVHFNIILSTTLSSFKEFRLLRFSM